VAPSHTAAKENRGAFASQSVLRARSACPRSQPTRPPAAASQDTHRTNNDQVDVTTTLWGHRDRCCCFRKRRRAGCVHKDQGERRGDCKQVAVQCINDRECTGVIVSREKSGAKFVKQLRLWAADEAGGRSELGLCSCCWCLPARILPKRTPCYTIYNVINGRGSDRKASTHNGNAGAIPSAHSFLTQPTHAALPPTCASPWLERGRARGRWAPRPHTRKMHSVAR